MTTEVILGILIPFIGTSLGAALVFVMRKSISENLQKILTGFAAGVMVAASFWSLLQPALESGESMGSLSFIPAAVGFLVGVGFLLLLDEITPHMHMDHQDEGPKSGLKRTTKLILAVTLHNIRKEWRSAWFTQVFCLGIPGSPPQARWRWPLVLPSRTSRRVRSCPCR